METVNKVCQKCRKRCKQRADCEVLYCPMFEHIKERPDTARKVAGVREVDVEGQIKPLHLPYKTQKWSQPMRDIIHW